MFFRVDDSLVARLVVTAASTLVAEASFHITLLTFNFGTFRTPTKFKSRSLGNDQVHVHYSITSRRVVSPTRA